MGQDDYIKRITLNSKLRLILEFTVLIYNEGGEGDGFVTLFSVLE